MTNSIGDIMRLAPVIPVLCIEDAATARPLGEALVAGGLRAIEVMLRTPAAYDAIRAIAGVPGAVVGAGTVLSAGQVSSAIEAGARFIVSPGLNNTLSSAVIAGGLPYLPGVSTANDIMRGLELGLTHFKFFPAQTSGGLPALKALAAPFAHCLFCPTGGVDEHNAPEWLAFSSVVCVGGSWVASGQLGGVQAKARAAFELRGSFGA